LVFSKVASSCRLALASMREARSRRGRDANRWVFDAVRAGLTSFVAISSANRSSASSTAAASRWRVVATKVAVRRGSASAPNIGALLLRP
jgi:hypothetical protein